MNVFDTTPIFIRTRKSEEVLGKALGAHRKDIVLATKDVSCGSVQAPTSQALSRIHIVEACEESLRTDSVRITSIVYQAHNFDSLTPLDETLRAFDDLVQAGKIRYFGSSNYLRLAGN